MHIEWEYDLPTDNSSEDYEYECPIFHKDGSIYFILEKNKKLEFHIINVDTGLSTTEIRSYRNNTISGKFFFIEHQDKIVIYTGNLWVYNNHTLSKLLELNAHNKINSYVVHKNYFIFANTNCLYCCNLDTLSLQWKLDVPNESPYPSGFISLFEDKIACYGNDCLLFIDIEQGKIINQIKIPRVNMLFTPIRLDEDNLLLGYTNCTNAGILKYKTATSKVVWKNKRCFEGPYVSKIYKLDNFVYWIKNDTELVCANVENGEIEFQAKTDPWLYTNLFFKDNYILFGTSGRNGYLKNLDAKSGNEHWSVFLKNGCAYFDFYKDTILVGDFDDNVYQIDVATGNKLQTLNVGGKVVGDIKVYDDYVYTVVWGNENKNIRLIKIKI